MDRSHAIVDRKLDERLAQINEMSDEELEKKLEKLIP